MEEYLLTFMKIFPKKWDAVNLQLTFATVMFIVFKPKIKSNFPYYLHSPFEKGWLNNLHLKADKTLNFNKNKELRMSL